MKYLLALVCSCVLYGAGVVDQQILPLGTSGNYIIKLSWVGDASTGTVPPTLITGGSSSVAQSTLLQINGYYFISVETTPGSPSPTSGYSVTIKDPAVIDILQGAATSLSPTVPAVFAVPGSSPPMNTSFTLNITGQSVPSAKGIVYVFLSKNPAPSTTSGGGGTGLTQLTGDVVAGPASGSVATTVVRINNQSLAALASGILKNTTGTGVPSIAIPGTDFAAPTSGSSILKGNGAGGFSNAAAGTDYAPATSGSVPLKGNGAGGFSNALAADIISLGNLFTLTTIGSSGASTYTGGTLNIPQYSGGGGASSANQLTDFLATNTSGTIQAVAAGQVRFGSQIYTLAGGNVTLSGTPATSTIFWYISSAGVLTAGHNSAATLTCSGCTVVTGVVAFPTDSDPLWQTTFTSNVFDTVVLSTMDKRAVYSQGPVVAAGSGVASSVIGSIQTLSTDPTVVPRYFVGSGAPGGTCTAGRDFYTDTTGLNLYFCDATNTWKQSNGGSSTVTEMHTFPACSVLSTSGPAVLQGGWETVTTGVTLNGLGGSLSNPCGMIFSTSGTAEARFSYWLNPNWSGTVKLTLATESLAGAGVVNTWSVKTACVATAGTWVGPSYNPPQSFTITSNASNNVVVFGSISSLTMIGCSPGNILLVDVTKTDTNAATSLVSASIQDSHS
jgi:hypothetical protein